MTRNAPLDIQRVTRWLSEIYVGALQRDRLSKRTAGTGTWFVEGEVFRAWLDKRGKVLWVMGKRELPPYYSVVAVANNLLLAGAGKTFLT